MYAKIFQKGRKENFNNLEETDDATTDSSTFHHEDNQQQRSTKKDALLKADDDERSFSSLSDSEDDGKGKASQSSNLPRKDDPVSVSKCSTDCIPQSSATAEGTVSSSVQQPKLGEPAVMETPEISDIFIDAQPIHYEEALKSWLNENKLQHYLDILTSKNYDIHSLKCAAELGESSVNQIIADIAMSSLPDQIKFKAAAKNLLATQLEQTKDAATYEIVPAEPVNDDVQYEIPLNSAFLTESTDEATKVDATITGASKVFQDKKLGMDYWEYSINIRANCHPYAESNSSVGFTINRRYGDFKWLRPALMGSYPGLIAPPLPGMSLESKMEKAMGKASQLLGLKESASDETPLLVRYRISGLNLLLMWIVRHEMLRNCKLVHSFFTLSSNDFQGFRHSWDETHKEAAVIQPALTSFMSTFRPKANLGEPYTKAKEFAVSIGKQVQNLKAFFEDLWDGLEINTSETLPEPSQCSAEEDAAVSVDRISTVLMYGNKLTEDVRSKFVLGVVYSRFWSGICEAILETVSKVEELHKTRERYPERSAELEEVIAVSGNRFAADFSFCREIIRVVGKELLRVSAELPVLLEDAKLNDFVI